MNSANQKEPEQNTDIADAEGNNLVLGLDGCRTGWVVAVLEEGLVQRFELISNLESGQHLLQTASLIFIDIPIGLPENQQPRTCDRQLRRKLRGRYASSVFSVPTREAVYAESYSEANEVNKEISGKGLSKQSWNICPKVRETDHYLQKDLTRSKKMLECHPELAFQLLEPDQILAKKKTTEGFDQRLSILKPYLCTTELVSGFLSNTLRKDVQPDDVLDAAVNAVACWFAVNNGIERLPVESHTDETGLPMHIHYPKNLERTESA